ncbi:MAG: hypothetical protein H7293_21605 [Candidatus Saccharibacteria bacterium]|nr:hypothetical protein [Rhodoferax sp.]
MRIAIRTTPLIALVASGMTLAQASKLPGGPTVPGPARIARAGYFQKQRGAWF